VAGDAAERPRVLVVDRAPHDAPARRRL